MRVWLINLGEPLPFDDNNVRLLRMGALANTLLAKGHQILWWTSTFSHQKKAQRFLKDTVIDINDSFSIYLLHAAGYKKNISFARILNLYRISHKFKILSSSIEKPDVIICSLPTVGLCYQATIYAQKNKIPIFLDIRDLWPDIFLDLCPKILHPICRFFLKPIYKMVEYSCKNSTGIMGNAPYFVEWGLRFAERSPRTLDKYFPFGYFSKQPLEVQIDEAKLFWSQFNLNRSDKEVIICFFGNLGYYSDLNIIIEAAKILKDKNKKIKFVICGSGDYLEKYKKNAIHYENIIFPGRVNAPKIWVLMRMSSLGLVHYKRNSFAYINNLPNKVIEYFSAGLPVISNLKGYFESLLSEKTCGVTYNNLDSFIESIENLYDNPQKLKQMSDNAYQLYLQNYVGEMVYQDMAKHIESSVSIPGKVEKSSAKRSVRQREYAECL